MIFPPIDDQNIVTIVTPFLPSAPSLQDWKWPAPGPPHGLVDVSGTVTRVALRQGAEPPEPETETTTAEDAAPCVTGENCDFHGGFVVFLDGNLGDFGLWRGFLASEIRSEWRFHQQTW